MFAGKDTFYREHFRSYIIYYNIKHEQYRVAFRKLLKSGDSELNPGPVGKKKQSMYRQNTTYYMYIIRKQIEWTKIEITRRWWWW